MITIAVFALIAFHPGYGFQNQFNNLHYESVPGTSPADGSKEGISLISVNQVQAPRQDVSYA
jgi:hypothetical protein